jgi:nitrogen fixation protein FixH
MARPFTGKHMALIMVAFFAVVVGVNFTMARLAIGSFGGTVVDNSYVASQRYNGWLAQARQQAALGWTPKVSMDAGRHVIVSIGTPTGVLEGAQIVATATHPVGRLPAVPLSFEQTGGVSRSRQTLAAGRWLIRLNVVLGKNRAAFDAEVGS